MNHGWRKKSINHGWRETVTIKTLLSCSKISLSNTGKRLLESKMQGVRHKQKTPVKSGCIFKTVRKATSDANISTSVTTSKVVNIPTLTMKNSEIMMAEIYWAFKVVQSNLSLNSCNDLNSVFWKMFPDCEIARSYSMAKTKLSYVINFGITTHFRTLLLEKLNKSKFCIVCFGESLNKVVQKCQMDFSLRCQDKTANEAVVQYFDLKFLSHASVQDLLKAFQQALKDLHESIMLQVSKIGPSVNWELYDELHKHLERVELSSLINIGSFCLHIVHGALETCITATEWNLKGILKSIYTLLQDTPARQADYISITECDKFPFAYCTTCWVEDKKVADRAVEIWPNIKKVVEKWEKLAPSKRPKGKNYQTVLAAFKDNCITAKLN